MTATETESENLVDEDEPKKPLQVDVKIDAKSTCERHVVVTIPQAEVGRYREEQFDDVAPKAELPGFRAGKAPRKLVESRFKEQVDEQVKNALVMDSLEQVTKGDHFSAISEPDFDYDAVELPDEGDFKYEFLIEVRPDFDVPKWEGMSLESPSCALTDKHIDEHLSRTLTRFMSGDPVDGQCEMGDHVTLNGTFSFEDKQIGCFEEESVPIREKLSFGDAVIEDFGQQIVGKEEGDTLRTTLTISEAAANEELRGKEVVCELEIHEVKRIEVDEINPATLENLGFDDTEDLRAFVRQELTRQFEYHQLKSLRKQIVDELTKGADWEMPETLIRRQTNRELQRMVLELQRSGFSQEQVNGYLNAARIDARENTIRSLREHFVLEKIAEELNIEPSSDDFDNEVDLIAEQSDSSPRKVRARLEKSGQMDAIRNQIVERQVIERITAAGKITEKEDLSFLKQEPVKSDIDFAIAGDFDDIPEAQHDNEPSKLPGAPKLPEADKTE